MNAMNTTTEMKITEQRVERVALSQCVPASYQRVTNDNQVADIVKNFDPAKLGTLTVSLRDGNYYIIDGLHRSKALRAMDYTHALCIVMTGLTYEQEAGYFRRQNQNKRAITTFDDFAAGLEEKDGECMKINDIAKANDFQIGRGKGFFRISSIHALSTIVKDYGYETLDDTLCVLANTWSGIPNATRSECLLGTAEFVSRYGTAHFPERLRDKFAVIYYDYAEAMRVKGSIGSTTSRKKFCRILVEHYNRGLNGRSKKRLVPEEM